MNLLTPDMNDNDFLFPGERFFLYWKTSSTLWKSKIQAYVKDSSFLVPINWSLHSETGDDYDFAESKSETDLAKLVAIAEELGKKVIFLLPLTPVPFLPNGGIPHLLARCPSLTIKGLPLVSVDSGDNINRIFSFYDPRIFAAFRVFVEKLGNYFSQKGINAEIYGMQCGFHENKRFYSYFDDTSKAFQRSFTNYVNKLKQENDFSNLVKTAEDEFLLVDRYKNDINKLYIETAQESLSGNWEGVLPFSFISGDMKSLLEKVCGSIEISEKVNEIFFSIGDNILPTTMLLPQQIKKGPCEKISMDCIAAFYNQKFHKRTFDEELFEAFIPLSFIEIYGPTLNEVHNRLQDNGLLNYITKENSLPYRIKSTEVLTTNNVEQVQFQDRVYTFLGNSLNESTFLYVLKLFMNGGKILLITDEMKESMSKRLECFILENSLHVEKCNYLTNISRTQLGSGELVFFQTKEIITLDQEKKKDFWKNICALFKFNHLVFNYPEDVHYFWLTRAANPRELQFEEIRRLCLYNISSYKKRMNFRLTKNIVFMKFLDQVNAQITTAPSEVDVELRPNGYVLLDFGLFS